MRGWAGQDLRRWRCLSAECGWHGALPRYERAEVEPAAGVELAALPEPSRTPTRPVLMALVAGLVIGLAGAATWHWKPAPRVSSLVRGAQALAPGESYDGDPLPASHPLMRVVYRASADPAAPVASAPQLPVAQPSGLTLRRQCAWGDPGRNPYRGTVEEALRAARLPEDVVRQIAAAVAAGRHADRLTIGNSGIRADRGGQIFDQRSFAMTYGRTLCLSTSVNFRIGHVERASLYAATDSKGKLHSVMVPDVCGNVSVLGSDVERTASDSAESTDVGGDSPNGNPQGQTGGRDPDPARAASSPASANQVPAPGTLLSVALGLATAAWATTRRRRRG